ncbi:MAG: aminoglycoside phosphotransferase family protein [Bacteroidales bacterium]|nr:aminoglycoside phosphotransferase family protein [Bacteroidales bacterium]
MLEQIVSNFRHNGTYASGAPYGSGHINDTFKIDTKETDQYNYILQRVNHHVFKDVPGLMENVERVTSHIRKKIEANPDSNPDREVLTVIPTHNNSSYHVDSDGNFWRMYIFIWDNKSYDVVDSPEKAFEGGRMFGQFQSQLADLPGKPLNDTIPNFHNIAWRLDTFMDTLKRNPVGRADLVKEEIDFVLARAEEMKTILRLGEAGEIPLRITHNDTKFNNVLLNQEDKGLCVIDLDTVMPGYVHYDFGDSIRTSTNTGAEDDPDLDKIEMDIHLFEGYTKGFLHETKDTLNQVEIDHLAFAGKLFPYMIGLRFITDYVDGDNYFKVHHEHHNLQRARAQFKLLTSMERQFEAMKEIVRKYAGGRDAKT